MGLQIDIAAIVANWKALAAKAPGARAAAVVKTVCQARPPLLKTVWPLPQKPSSLQSMAILSAMSDASARRLCGVFAAKSAITSAVLPFA